MSADDQNQGQNEARDERLRVDSAKVDVARLRLTGIDRAVFGTAKRHAPDDHDRLFRQTLAGFFGHG